jgi:predicted AAA+ superfamily ATPase
MRELVRSGVSQKRILYLNFEDERLNLKAADLDLVLQAYQELYPDTKWKDCYFFFDEIQNIEHWEKFARRCYDTITKNIYLTGSNSNLLSQEIATAMRGRTLTYEILPLSFPEFLHFKKVDSKKQGTAALARMRKLFREYLMEGGYPEVTLLADSLKVQALQEYFDVMTYRDLVERYEFTNLTVIKYFLKRIASTTGSYLSLNKIYNELRSLNYKLDKNFLYELNEGAKAVYLSLPISKFDFSELKRTNSDKKTYFIDNGLLNAITFKFSQDFGKMLENMVYLEFRRQKKNVFYFKDVKECDFVLYEEDKKPLLVQVCFDLADPDTYHREIASLVYCCKKTKSNVGIVISMTSQEPKVVDGIKIKFIDAMEFCLRNVSI